VACQYFRFIIRRLGPVGRANTEGPARFVAPAANLDSSGQLGTQAPMARLAGGASGGQAEQRVFENPAHGGCAAAAGFSKVVKIDSYLRTWPTCHPAAEVRDPPSQSGRPRRPAPPDSRCPLRGW